MNTLQEKIIAKQIFGELSGLINDLADSCLELGDSDLGYYHRYDKDDVMNALLVFNHVLGNFVFHRLTDQNKTLDEKCESVESLGSEINKLIFKYCGFDTKEFYK